MHLEIGDQSEGGEAIGRTRFGAYPVSGAQHHAAAAVAPAFTAHGAASIVDLARSIVVARISGLLDVETLAASVLVSESTLRRAVHAETGQRLSAFILNIRLDQAHAWLSSNNEFRSQQQITHALGLRSAQAFARAYREKFGESMVDTRLRARDHSDDIEAAK